MCNASVQAGTMVQGCISVNLPQHHLKTLLVNQLCSMSTSRSPPLNDKHQISHLTLDAPIFFDILPPTARLTEAYNYDHM